MHKIFRLEAFGEGSKLTEIILPTQEELAEEIRQVTEGLFPGEHTSELIAAAVLRRFGVEGE